MERRMTLKTPLQNGSETITELVFQGPLKGRHMKGLPLALCYDHLLTIGGRMCGQPPSVMEELCGEDLATVLGVVTDFLPAGPRTGQ